MPWPDKKLLPKTSPAKLAPNPTASTAKWLKLSKKRTLKNLQYLERLALLPNLNLLSVSNQNRKYNRLQEPDVWSKTVKKSEKAVYFLK